MLQSEAKPPSPCFSEFRACECYRHSKSSGCALAQSRALFSLFSAVTNDPAQPKGCAQVPSVMAWRFLDLQHPAWKDSTGKEQLGRQRDGEHRAPAVPHFCFP